jgi:CheY-like chemotaxis protein
MSETNGSGNVFNTRQSPVQVLAVDDNAINLRWMTVSLTRLGCQVDTAEDGAAAVAKFANKQYDVILMDIMMPVMDGIAATREIRKMEAERQTVPANRVKIIAITANAFEDDRVKLFGAGIDHFLSKPFEIVELQQILNL